MMRSAAANVLRDPSSAVLSIATALESALQTTWQQLKDDARSKPWTRRNMISDLAKSAILSTDDSKAVLTLLDMRNRIAHTDEVPSSDDAEKFFKQTLAIIEKLNVKNERKGS
jgi:hypothetical protein